MHEQNTHSDYIHQIKTLFLFDDFEKITIMIYMVLL